MTIVLTLSLFHGLLFLTCFYYHKSFYFGKGTQSSELKKSQSQNKFHQLGPLGRVGLVVAMSVCCILSVPFPCIFFEWSDWCRAASSVDWCHLNLDLDLE